MAGTDDIIGRWIHEAEKSGEVEKLPGYGKPLQLDDDKHVPAKYRVAFRVLKNAGYAPPEVEMMQRRAALKEAIDAATDDVSRSELQAQLNELNQKLDVALGKFRTGA